MSGCTERQFIVRSFLIVVSALVFTQPLEAKNSIVPKVLPAYFNENEFSDCLSEVISQDHKTLESLMPRRAEIAFRRDELTSQTMSPDLCRMAASTVCNAMGFDSQGLMGDLVQPLGCVLNRMMDRRMYYHSAALIDCHDYKTNDTPLLWRLNAYYEQQIGAKGINRDKQLNDVDILSEVATLQEGKGFQQPQRKCVADKAEPLVRWLLGKKRGQVSHWALFRKAREIYGDSIVALGIIGEMFSQEICPSRKRSCVLNNRMRPLFPSDQIDNVGYNFHFWAHLSIVITEEDEFGSIGNYVLEWMKDADAGDYSANRLGIEAGQKAIQKTRIAIAPLNRLVGFSQPSCHLE